ncbi:MAG: hypothetical protein IKP25_09425 [Ruminococcus sp.]|nr:hypothetical protein [Ruminococcus sp.]
MIYVSKEKLDRDFERYSIDRWLNTTVSIMGKAAIPIVIIELIIAVAMQDKLQWWISMLIFAVLDFITPFIVCFSLIWINAGIKISKSAGGISAALKTSGTIKRSRPYFILIQNEICSDKVLAEAKRLAETANKQSYEYISSLCHLIGCHTLRCEFDEASACLEEMKKLPETDLISRNDHMIAILDYAMAKHDDDLFISAISEYADILNTLTERNPSAVPALLAIAAYEQMLYGNCENASQYLGWSMEYRLRMQKNGKFVNTPAASNLTKYNTAALLLDMAEVHIMCGDTERARQEVKMASENAEKLGIDIPPIFLRERERLLERLTKIEI